MGADSPDDQVDDAEVEDLLVRVVVRDLLLLLLDLPDQLLGLSETRRGGDREADKHHGVRRSLNLQPR